MALVDDLSKDLYGDQPGAVIYCPANERTFIEQLKFAHKVYASTTEEAMIIETERLKSLGLNHDEAQTLIACEIVKFTKWAESQ